MKPSPYPFFRRIWEYVKWEFCELTFHTKHRINNTKARWSIEYRACLPGNDQERTYSCEIVGPYKMACTKAREMKGHIVGTIEAEILWDDYRRDDPADWWKR